VAPVAPVDPRGPGPPENPVNPVAPGGPAQTARYTKTTLWIIENTYDRRTSKRSSFPGQPEYAATRKVESIWILMKQEMMGVAAGPYANHLHLIPDT